MKFLINGPKGIEQREIPDEFIPEDSFFAGMKRKWEAENNMTDKDNEKVFKLEMDLDEFDVISDYLTSHVLPHSSWFETLNIYVKDEYIESICQEEYMRKNMYKPGYENDPININPYYGLVKLDENIWNDIIECIKENEVPNENILFREAKLKPHPWKTVQHNLRSIEKINNVFIAGGRVFSLLFDTKYGDTDFFIYGVTEKEAEDKIGEVCREVEDRRSIVRNGNAVTFKSKSYSTYQVVLRLYRTPSEIIHGFDIDGCCMGTDGKDIYITRRCLYSLKKGFNTVNFERLSPSYTYRLVKYSKKGMKIRDTHFVRANVKVIPNEDFFFYGGFNFGFEPFVYYFPRINDRMSLKKKILNSLKGIDFLIFVEEYNNRFKYIADFIFMNKGVDRFVNIQYIFDGEAHLYKNVSREGSYYLVNEYKRGDVDTTLTRPSDNEHPEEHSDEEEEREHCNIDVYKDTPFDILKKAYPGCPKSEINAFLKKVNSYVPLVKDEEIEKRLIEKGYTKLRTYEGVNEIKGINKSLEVSDYFTNQVCSLLKCDIKWMINHRINLDAIKELISFPEESEESLEGYFNYKVDSKIEIILKHHGIERLYEGEFRLINAGKYIEIYDNKGSFVNRGKVIYLHYCYINGVKVDRERITPDNFERFSSGVIVKIDACDYKVEISVCKVRWTYISKQKSYELISFNSLYYVLHVNDKIYSFLEKVGKVSFKRDVSFKITNPGEQMTNTFNVLVLEDNNEWYNGKYYNYSS